MKKTDTYAFIKKQVLLSSILLFGIVNVFAQAPLVSSFSPASGPIGTAVTITGTGFNATTANNIVFFGATRAKVTAASTTSLTVTVPAGATYQPISILNGSTALTGYSDQPFVTTFQPAKGAITNATFMPAVTYNTTHTPGDVSVSDIDGDGKPDLIVADNLGDSSNANTVAVFRNTSVIGSINGSSFAPKIEFAASNSTLAATVGDIDGDGKPDLIVVNSEDSTISIFRNTSTIGSISFAAPVIIHSIYGPFLARIADIDGDGKPDLVVLSYNDVAPNYNGFFNTISVFRNTGTTGAVSFAPGVAIFSGYGNYSEEDIAIGDIDGDGKPDIVANLYIPGEVAILRNISTPGFITSANSFAAPVFLSVRNSQGLVLPYNISIGDLDGDGKPDLVVVNNGSPPYHLSLFRNTGTIGSISFAAEVDIPVGANEPFVSAIGDLNGDGKPDIVVTLGENTNSIGVFRNISVAGALTSGSFAPVVNFEGGVTADGLANLAIADLDGDGRADIIVADNTVTTLSVLHNAASSVATLINLTVSQGTLTPAFASETINYTDTVANSVTSITVTPTVTDTTATITVNGVTVISGTASGAIPLTVGPNTITVVVTAQDGTATETYTVTVIRSASSDASLIDLTVSEGVLTPVFNSGTTAYTDTVSYLVTSITVTPTVSNNYATVTINGVVVASGTPSNAIPLTVGENTITVIVTAQDGVTTDTYTIMVYRGEVSNVIYVPNAFTPNGDGINDQVHVHSENIKSLKFNIYDQWGELLFASVNQENGWDGTYKGAKEPVGVYVYYLEAVMNDGTKVNKKGTIAIIR